jgi:HSP20 family protein
VRKQDIDVRIDGNQVTVSAEVRKSTEEKEAGRILRRERRTGQATRSFTLACAVDEAKAQAHYEAGVLSLLLPKKPGATARRLTVQ